MVKMDYFEMCLLKLSLKEINLQYAHIRASSVVQWVKNSPAMQETQEMQVRSLGWEGPLGGAREVGSPCEWRGGARHCSRAMVGESGLETC